MSQIGLFSDVGGNSLKRLTIDSGAVFDKTRLYRYRLWRHWNPVDGFVLWVALNPSTADAVDDDPTVTRMMGFAHAWGYGGLELINLFALRSTSPLVLYSHPNPIGPDNDIHILDQVGKASRIIAAWGNHGALRQRSAHVVRLVAATGRTLECLGVNERTKQPRHPLYLRGDLQPVPYGVAA